MSADRTQALIAALARDARPVRPVPALRWQIACVAATAAGVAALAIAGLGLRPLGHPLFASGSPFLWMTVGLGVAGVGGVSSALAFARPGRESAGWVALGVATVALLTAALVDAQLVEGSAAASEPIWNGKAEIPCVVASLLFGLPVAILATRLAARAAPLRIGLTALVTAGGASALGTLAAHLICRTPGEWHVAVIHALEPIAGTILFAAPLYLLLRRWHRIALRRWSQRNGHGNAAALRAPRS